MCCGVSRGLALEKFSGSFNKLGINERIMNSEVIKMVIINISL